LLIISYLGSVGIATLSDSIIPYLGETMLGMPDRDIHVGFIEKWWLVNPSAVLGVAIACFNPSTKLPHAGARIIEHMGVIISYYYGDGRRIIALVRIFCGFYLSFFCRMDTMLFKRHSLSAFICERTK